MSLTVQLAVFATASLVFLFGLRRWLKSIFTGGASAAGDSLSEGMAGQEAKVLEPIAPGAAGRVELNRRADRGRVRPSRVYVGWLISSRASAPQFAVAVEAGERMAVV